MIKMTKRIPSVALIALLLVFGACKGESPTAPPPGGSIPPGGTTPPSGVTLTLTTSNSDPLVDSTVVITANVTLNGQPVANGTAVEFATNNGTFTDTQASTTIRTTTNGVASATLTAATPGATRITATVNNVTRTADVTFRARPVTPPVPGTAPTIQSITPSIGRPSGGQTIRITGTNFIGPVKVLFDVGGAAPVEGFVVSRTDTQIEVITPPVNLGAGQELISRVIVITRAGSTNEQRVDVTQGFTFRNEQLTPRISTATPNSGPILGGTLVSIIGDGFQAPVQVLFGSAEARVVQVGFAEIIVEAPAARDTSPNGTGPITGPIDITVVNINSQTRTTLAGGFRYVAAIQVIAAGPTEGPSTGGTRVTIDGNGFVAPVAVSIGGVAATPTFVSGTRIIAITSGVEVDNCADITGPITVTNISNGDSASGPAFTYEVPSLIITGVTGPNPIIPGSPITVTVLNAGLFPQLRIGTSGAPITGTTAGPNGTTLFTTVVPSSITLSTAACPGGGTREIQTSFDLTFSSAETGCTFTLPGGLIVSPEPFGELFLTPNPLNLTATTDNPATPLVNETRSGSGTFSIVNTGAANLLITGVTPLVSGNYTVTNDPTGTSLTPCEQAIVAVRYDPEAPGNASSVQITVTATTTDGVTTRNLSARETVIGRTQ